VNRTFLKNIESLCPVCLEEIKAQLFLQNGKVTITKTCMEHGSFSDIVDPNGNLYLRTISKRHKRHNPYGLVLPITSRCNLRCKWCYLPDKNIEFDINQIRNIIDNCPHRFIVFSGGEPTLRKELLELITYVRRRYPNKFTVLLTNGIKLAGKSYVKELKEAGLQYVILSLNGFRQETHQHISNQGLIELKKQALKNLKKFKIWTILSMTLVKGVNEDELVKVYQYGMKNIQFIRQIRLRNVSEIGLYKKDDHIYLSDMLELVSEATGFSIDEMCRNNLMTNGLFNTGNYFVLDIFKALKKRYAHSSWGSLRFLSHCVKLVGILNTFRMFFEPFQPKETRLMFRIEIFSWPTASNIDLSECRLFCIDHVTNQGEILPFWEALYKNDKLRLSEERNSKCRIEVNQFVGSS
jgi:uncharacterized radical SAM superfamily Fe-S cluster-containing enzyme